MKKLLCLLLVLLLVGCSSEKYDTTSKVVTCVITNTSTIYDNFSATLQEVEVQRQEEYIMTVEEGILVEMLIKTYVTKDEILKYHNHSVEEFYNDQKVLIDTYESRNMTGPSDVSYYEDGVVLHYLVDLHDMSDYADEYLVDERSEDGKVIFDKFEKAYLSNLSCEILK